MSVPLFLGGAAIAVPAPTFLPIVYAIEVDWTGDGNFAHAYSDISADALGGAGFRGRNTSSNLTGRSTAGTLEVALRNPDGKYADYNGSSPLYGSLLPNRKVRIRITSPVVTTLWTGYLDRIELHEGTPLSATLFASGAFAQLTGPNGPKISPAAQASATTGAVLGVILDAVSWPAAARTIATGDVTLPVWFANAEYPFGAMQAVELTEMGFLFEGTSWDVQFESRNQRTTGVYRSVQRTFSDIPGEQIYFDAIQQESPFRELFNYAEIPVQAYTAQSLAVLWTLVTGANPTLTPGQSSPFYATYPDPNDSTQSGYVSAWTTPVVGTDITQTGVSNGDLSVAVVKAANQMLITITNNHPSATATLTLVQARGVANTPDPPTKTVSQDAISSTAYGTRSYPAGSAWFGNLNDAQAAGDYIVGFAKDPRPLLTVTVSPYSYASLLALVSTQISNRVIVNATRLNTGLGIRGEFFVESVAFSWQNRRPPRFTFQLSPANANAFWELDVSQLDATTILAP